MFGCLLNKRKQNQSQKLVRDTAFYNVLDLLDKEDQEQGHKRQRDEERNDNLGHGELGLLHIRLSVGIAVLVHLNDFVKDTVVAAGLVPDEQNKGNHQGDGGGLADAHDVLLQLFLGQLFMERPEPMRALDNLGLEGRVEGAGDEQAKGGDQQQPSADLGYHGMELLADAAQSADEEAEAKTQQQIGQDAAEDGGLDDGNQVAFIAVVLGAACVMLGNQDDKQDDLNDGAKRRLN